MLLFLRLILGGINMIRLLRRGLWLKGLFFWAVLSAPILSWAERQSEIEVAYKAQQYKRLLIGYALTQWTSDEAPISLLAAQIHQESRWNPTARSAFACGLSQFTPDTASWISDKYKVNVGPGDCTNPAWSLRAQSAYMRYLQTQKIAEGRTACDNWRFTLWGYNGGPGWVKRDKEKARLAARDWLSASVVSSFNAGRAEAFFKENRGYDVAILARWQRLYSTWGVVQVCDFY